MDILLDFFGWIYEDLFKGESPIDYCTLTSFKNVSMLCKYFLEDETLKNSVLWRKICTPKDNSHAEKLLVVLSATDALFGSKMCQKVEKTLISEELAQNSAGFPIPSLYLTGTTF